MCKGCKRNGQTTRWTQNKVCWFACRQSLVDRQYCFQIVGNVNRNTKMIVECRNVLWLCIVHFFISICFRPKIACVYCGKMASFSCGRCGDFYCSEECQTDDWLQHKRICFEKPYVFVLQIIRFFFVFDCYAFVCFNIVSFCILQETCANCAEAQRWPWKDAAAASITKTTPSHCPAKSLPMAFLAAAFGWSCSALYQPHRLERLWGRRVRDQGPSCFV